MSPRDGTGANAKAITYEYDSANQLIRENDPYVGTTYTWTYDDAGNITSKKRYNYTTGILGSVVRTDSYSYTDASWGDLLTVYNGRTFTYDALGNLTSDGIWAYTWQQGRQLASMTTGTTTWSYTYDSNGMRIGRTNGTDTYTYLYSNGLLTQMTKNGVVLYFTYDAAGMPLTVQYKGAVYYYVTNLQGDVVAILDGSGNAVAKYLYNAWGELLSATGPMLSSLGALNPLLYRGYVYDRETGLYYLQSRYYDSQIGEQSDGSPMPLNT